MTLEICCMVFLLFSLDKHVIHVDFHCVYDLLLKDLVDELLVRYPCILKSEGHDFVAVRTSVNDKGCCFHVWLVHIYLVVSGVSIDEA